MEIKVEPFRDDRFRELARQILNAHEIAGDDCIDHVAAALRAAEREGAEKMRERCVRIAEEEAEARNCIHPSDRAVGGRESAFRVVAAIRALRDEPEVAAKGGGCQASDLKGRR